MTEQKPPPADPAGAPSPGNQFCGDRQNEAFNPPPPPPPPPGSDADGRPLNRIKAASVDHKATS